MSLNNWTSTAHLIALMVTSEIAAVHTLAAMVKATGHITHQRDPETGSHLDRMSRFSLLIANALSEKNELDDDYIQHVFMFSPLHDIGKIGYTGSYPAQARQAVRGRDGRHEDPRGKRPGK